MKMPVLFVGHGSPLNAITDNPFKDAFIRLGERIKPEAILVISAHWFTNQSFVDPSLEPEQIFDMSGFPKELYEVKYRPQGSPMLARRVKELLGDDVKENTDWGYRSWQLGCSEMDVSSGRYSHHAAFGQRRLSSRGILCLG